MVGIGIGVGIGDGATGSVVLDGGGQTPLLMTSRLNVNGQNNYVGSDGVDLDSNSRISCWNETNVEVTFLKAIFCNWRATSTNEADGYNAITVEASVEYPAGTFTRLTFGGADSIVIPASAPDHHATTDSVAVSIPADAQFWIRTWVSVTTGLKWVQGYTIQTTIGELADFATGVNKVMGGTITNAGVTANRRGFGPSAVIATGFVGTPVDKAFAGIGASSMQGIGGTLVDSRGNLGYVGFAMQTRFPFVNLGYTGQQTTQQNGNFSRRAAFINMAGVTDVICQYGFNDVQISGRTAAQIHTDLESLWDLFPTKRVTQCTITPSTTSTDQWDTVANQTIDPTPAGAFSPGGVRDQLNAIIRGEPFPLYRCLDVTSVAESGPDSGKWLSRESANVHLEPKWLKTVNGSPTTTTVPYTSPAIPDNRLAFGGAIIFTSGVLNGLRISVTSNNSTQVVIPAQASASSPGDTFEGFAVRGRFVTDGVHAANHTHLEGGFGGQHVIAEYIVNELGAW